MSDFEIQRLYKVRFAHSRHTIVPYMFSLAWRLYNHGAPDTFPSTLCTLQWRKQRGAAPLESGTAVWNCHVFYPRRFKSAGECSDLFHSSVRSASHSTYVRVRRVACLSARAVFSFKGLLDGDSRLLAASENNGSRPASTEHYIYNIFNAITDRLYPTNKIRVFPTDVGRRAAATSWNTVCFTDSWTKTNKSLFEFIVILLTIFAVVYIYFVD